MIEKREYMQNWAVMNWYMEALALYMKKHRINLKQALKKINITYPTHTRAKNGELSRRDTIDKVIKARLSITII